jgi:spore germination cell wall hydrolase CwlJ-like protein
MHCDIYRSHHMTIAFPFQPARPWQSHPRETAIFALIGTAALVAIAGVSGATSTFGELAATPATEAATPALPTATDLRDVAPEQAMALNAQMPIAALPVTAARPFSLGKASTAARAQALECLTSAIYYEAGQETDQGQRAVAQVVLNRVRHAAYPSSVCGVVYQGSTRVTGCQFTFTCDGSLAHTPMASAWKRARIVAQQALAGAVFTPVGLATHYHANYVMPYWAPTLVKTHIEGAHLFYRWAGTWGRAAAFGQKYVAREASASALRLAALSVPHVLPRAISSTATAIAKLDKVDGVEVKTADGGRVTAHFSPQARAAVEAVKVVPYVERLEASDNLRRALDGASSEGAESKPFGRAEATPAIDTKTSANTPATDAVQPAS